MLKPPHTKPAVPTGLYPIIDVAHVPTLPLYKACELVLAAEIPWLQVRAKHLSREQFAKDARQAIYLKIHNPFLFIVNHDLALADAIGADGVHLTAHSESIQTARRVLGETALIGYSAHRKDEALRAAEAGADYISFGAIFETPHKEAGHPIQGVEALWELIDACPVPVIAVGGIDRTTIPLLKRSAGAHPLHGFSAIRALLHSDDVTEAARQLRIMGRKIDAS